MVSFFQGREGLLIGDDIHSFDVVIRSPDGVVGSVQLGDFPDAFFGDYAVEPCVQRSLYGVHRSRSGTEAAIQR